MIYMLVILIVILVIVTAYLILKTIANEAVIVTNIHRLPHSLSKPLPRALQNGSMAMFIHNLGLGLLQLEFVH